MNKFAEVQQNEGRYMKEDQKSITKKKKVNVAIDNISEGERLEQLYQSTRLVFNNMSCMTMTESKLDMYMHLKKEFSSMGDYKDSKDYVKQCTDCYKVIEAGLIKKEYEDCCIKLEFAKTDKEYQELGRDFRKLKDYKESVKWAEQCERILESKAKKIKYAMIRKMSIIVVLIILLVLGNTRIGRYNISKVCNKLNFYGKSAEMYKSLGSYKDSSKRYKESAYKEAARLEKEGKYLETQKIYYDIHGYQDSAVRLVALEKRILEESNIGDKVKVGASLWIVLDKQEDKVLCIKYKPLSNIVYSDEEKDVTWETSQIRNYLNSEYIKKIFCEEEVANLLYTVVITSDNMKYNTKGGNQTQDKLYILSSDDVLKYESVLSIMVTKSSWLRSSGGLQCAVSVYNGKDVNSYGNLATKEHVYTYPVFWYSLK